MIEQHLAVNLFGSLKMSRAFLPKLKRSQGAIVDTLLDGARPVATHARLRHFKSRRVQHDAIAESTPCRSSRDGPWRFLGPTDTDMTQALNPKASPEAVAQGISTGFRIRKRISSRSRSQR